MKKNEIIEYLKNEKISSSDKIDMVCNTGIVSETILIEFARFCEWHAMLSCGEEKNEFRLAYLRSEYGFSADMAQETSHDSACEIAANYVGSRDLDKMVSEIKDFQVSHLVDMVRFCD